jgi:hypothetical protein
VPTKKRKKYRHHLLQSLDEPYTTLHTIIDQIKENVKVGKRAQLHQAFLCSPPPHWEFSCKHFGLNFDEDDDDSQNIVAYKQRNRAVLFRPFPKSEVASAYSLSLSPLLFVAFNGPPPFLPVD